MPASVETRAKSCGLLKMEDTYDMNCWLYVDMPADRILNAPDRFLRQVWLECCGRLSAFQGAGKSSKAGRFLPATSSCTFTIWGT